MKEVSLFISVIVSFLLTMIIGNFLYKFENKKAFNYLNTFPFEMESKKDSKITLLFRILLGVFICISCIDVLYLLIFHYDSNFNSRFLGGMLILEAFMILGVFLVSTQLYKGHIIVSSLLFVLNSFSYIVLGYNSLINNHPLWVSIVSFIIGFILLIIMFSPLLKDWFKITRKVENDEETTSRMKINLFVFNEWINILFYISMLLICTIVSVL